MNEITREQIIQSIAHLAKSKGQTWLSNKEFLAESGITSYQVKKYFIRWNDAVKAAGLQALDKTGRPDKKRGMTKQDLLSLSDQIASRLGRRRISQSEFTKEAGISYRPIHRLYGSWESFASEAGLQLHPAHKQKIPDELLFNEFFRIASRLMRYAESNLAGRYTMLNIRFFLLVNFLVHLK